MRSPKNSTGFTLIELLVAMTLFAILATITIIVMNPSELFAQARDTQRITDLESLKKAVDFYVASSPANAALHSGSFVCGTHFGASAAGVTSPFAAGTLANAGLRDTDGTGWIPINFDGSLYGAPFELLPIDPVNTSTKFYAYSCDQVTKKFEILTDMESDKFSNGGDGDIESIDTGSDPNFYEVGSDPGLDL